jgi:hypothetical protein
MEVLVVPVKSARMVPDPRGPDIDARHRFGERGVSRRTRMPVVVGMPVFVGSLVLEAGEQIADLARGVELRMVADAMYGDY